MKNISDEWVAGLLEGEGCFSFFNKKDYMQCAVFCEMTDKDVLETIHNYLGYGRINSRGTRKGKRKETWIFSVQKQKDVLDLCNRVLPFMHSRRSKRISDIIKYLEKRINNES